MTYFAARAARTAEIQAVPVGGQVTLVKADTNVVAWAHRFGTEGSVTFDVLEVPAADVRKNDLVIRFNQVCQVTAVTHAPASRIAPASTRVHISGDWSGYRSDDMVTVYRPATEEVVAETVTEVATETVTEVATETVTEEAPAANYAGITANTVRSFAPNYPGARTLAEATPMMINGKRVTAQVVGASTYTVWVGGLIVAQGELDGTEGNLNDFFVAESLLATVRGF